MMAQPRPQAQLAALYRLPSELLLQITNHLRAKTASDLVHLRNLCLVSRKLLPIAREQLYANAELPTSCGCHPTINSAVQLLRTLLEHPALAHHVKALRFSVVRRNVGKLYQDEYPARHLDLPALRDLCAGQLANLGYDEEHPWMASLRNNIESAYAGLLLCILPNLAKLQYVVKELHRGCPVVDPNSAFFATSYPPASLATVFKANIQELCMTDLTFLRSLAFDNLNVLRITSVTVQTLLQLNGPRTFRGTARLSELCVGLSVYLMDEDCVNDMQVNFRDLIDALGCNQLTTLKLKLEHESYCLIHSPEFDVQLMLDQLSSLQATLKFLEIDLDPLDDTGEWDYILAHCKNTGSSMAKFKNLELLKIPQDFLFSNMESEQKIEPSDLPKKLRRLEIICPDEDIVPWAKGILNAPDELEDLREIFLICRDEVKIPASIFSTEVKPVWPDLLIMCNITTYIVDLTENTTKSLPTLYEDDPGESDEDDESDDMNEDDEMESASENSGDESDEDMPGLESLEAVPGIMIDDMD